MTKVKLVAITEPKVQGVQTVEEFVAFAARVSNPSNQMNGETAPKLLKYLMNNKHWSPFEMVHIVMEIETTRAIAHQIVRHRSFAFQEFSQRYADPAALGAMYVPSEPRLQDAKNRQNSVELDDEELKSWWYQEQAVLMQHATELYQEAISRGIAKEVARNPLPEGLTKSRLYMAGSLRSWLHYLQVRGPGSGTQKEHMDVAAGAKTIIIEHFPSIAGLLELQNEENGK